MKKTLKTFSVIAMIIITLLSSAGCKNVGLLCTFPEKGTFSQELYDEIVRFYDSTPADDFGDGTGTIAWWDEYPIFSSGNSKRLEKMMADLDVTGSRNDEGRGPFARLVDSLTGIPALDLLHENGYRGGAWIECQGTTVAYIMALHQLEDGSFEIDPRTDAAKVEAWIWGWNSNSPDVKKDSNYIAWAGVHAFVNNEEWAYPYVLSNYPEIDTPTFPDGTPAVGYYEGGDRTTPHLAVFYDSSTTKDINGYYFRSGGSGLTEGGNKYADKAYDGSVYKYFTYDYINLAKDTADPFWIQYAKNSIDFWVQQGVDYFWVDNWNGWDSIGNCPIYCAFGDWSEYRFKEYLKNHPELGVSDTDNFSITEYLKNKAAELDPECNYNEINDKVWLRPEWRDDKIWMSYIAYKSGISTAYNSEIHRLVKEASLKYRGDPDAVAVCGNDFPYMTFGACEGDSLDIISTEFNDDYLAATFGRTNGFAPNRYACHAFRLMADTARSHNAVIWYYASKYPYTDVSGKVYGYEALACNVLLHQAYSGTDNSNLDLNKTTKKLKDIYSDRRAYAGIGIVYSPDSETSYLIPGGFSCGGDNPHDLSYSGWCSALDELNVPYRSIQMDRLEERIDSIELLILPEICSVNSAVQDLLKKFLDKGRTVVITGRDSGLYDSIDNSFIKRKSPLLVDFAKKYRGKGKIIYMENDPCFGYFQENKESDYDTMYTKYLADIEKTVKKWIKKGYVLDYLSSETITSKDSIITSLNYSETNKTFFIDIVNMQYDHETDVLTPMPEITDLKVRVPSVFWGYGYTVKMFSNGTEEIIELEEGKDFTVEGPYIDLKIPSFDVYCTVMISK